MPRVLVVDADASTADQLGHALAPSGHEILAATDSSEAWSWAQAGGIDLIVADLHLPAVNPVALASELRKKLAPYPVPFIYLTASISDDVGLLASLASRGSLFLFTKPLRIAELTQTVTALLGSVHTEQGVFGDGSHDQLLARIEADSESGVFTAYQDEVVKKIVFRDGALTFCASSDPRDRVGQTFVKAGLISEQDLAEAMALKVDDPEESLGKILQAQAKITPEQADKVIRRRTKENVLDLYLWESGKWIYFGGGVPVIDYSDPFRIELAALRAEGQRRAKRWPRLIKIFTDDAMTFEVVEGQTPAAGSLRPGDKKILELVASGKNLGELRFEVRGQDYALFSRLGEFLDKGIARIVKKARGNTHAGKKKKPGTAVRVMLEAAEKAMDTGDLRGARDAYRDVLSIDPANADARRGLAEVDTSTSQQIVAVGFESTRTVRLAVPISQLTTEKWDPAHAFVLSRLAAGAMTIQALIDVVPMTQGELLVILRRVQEEKLIVVA